MVTPTSTTPGTAQLPHSKRAVEDGQRGVRRWLWFMWWVVFVMVIIGGITRLTGSGLSMVEWRPLMGALPPMSEAEWLDVFAKYQQSPQYLTVNQWMTLDDFKSIFFWEYFHRLFGRLIGVFFFFPFVWFMVRGRLKGRLAVRTVIAFFLGGAQGLLGWYMVKSGLVNEPSVSHYRLAAHLCLAFFVGMYLVWIAWDLRAPPLKVDAAARPESKWVWGFLVLLAIQIVWGAFMAGNRAGHLSPTFPDMNGEFLPAGAFATDASWLSDLLNNPWTIHWFHRTLGWLVLAAGIALAVHLFRRAKASADGLAIDVHKAGQWMAAGIALQFLLGVITVVLHVPVWAGVMHQGGAYLLLTVSVRILWLTKERSVLA